MKTINKYTVVITVWVARDVDHTIDYTRSVYAPTEDQAVWLAKQDVVVETVMHLDHKFDYEKPVPLIVSKLKSITVEKKDVDEAEYKTGWLTDADVDKINLGGK